MSDQLEETCDHEIVVTYSRKWWAPWRKTYRLRCWFCDFEQKEPS